jgi:hypothetical protein
VGVVLWFRASTSALKEKQTHAATITQQSVERTSAENTTKLLTLAKYKLQRERAVTFDTSTAILLRDALPILHNGK